MNTKPALIGQLTHAWASTANKNRANVWHGDVLWCHKIIELKGETTEDALKGQCFLWKPGEED